MSKIQFYRAIPLRDGPGLLGHVSITGGMRYVDVSHGYKSSELLRPVFEETAVADPPTEIPPPDFPFVWYESGPMRVERMIHVDEYGVEHEQDPPL